MKPIFILAALGLVISGMAYALNSKVDSSSSTTISSNNSVMEASSEKPFSHRIVVYYFHGNVRCRTCKTIEAYTRKSLETMFPKALQDGSLVFRPVNVDESNNEHFVEQYQLMTRSVVVQEIVDNKPGRWKTLDGVWDVVGDESKFSLYIQSEIKPWLGEN